MCFAMVNTWKHGISQVRLYDPYGPGDVARYLSKGRFSSAADCGGREYITAEADHVHGGN
jgi:hypothetical protein